MTRTATAILIRALRSGKPVGTACDRTEKHLQSQGYVHFVDAHLMVLTARGKRFARKIVADAALGLQRGK